MQKYKREMQKHKRLMKAQSKPSSIMSQPETKAQNKFKHILANDLVAKSNILVHENAPATKNPEREIITSNFIQLHTSTSYVLAAATSSKRAIPAPTTTSDPYAFGVYKHEGSLKPREQYKSCVDIHDDDILKMWKTG